MTLRPASMADAAFLLTLRQDRNVRKSEWYQGLVTHTAHLAWCQRVLLDANTVVWIIEHGKRAVGCVRVSGLDRMPEIGIALLPEARGKGIGTAAIREATQYLTERGFGPVRAHIRADNAVSVRAFYKVGYRLAAYEYTYGV